MDVRSLMYRSFQDQKKLEKIAEQNKQAEKSEGPKVHNILKQTKDEQVMGYRVVR